MTTLEQAARQALEALETRCGTHAEERSPNGAIASLRQALEQAENQWHEPVVTAFDVKIDGRALQVLDGMVSPSVDGDRNPARMIAGEGNSGYGLYISREDWSEDDATLLAEIPPLYTEPLQRKPLTRDQALKIVAAHPDVMLAIRMTEAAHGIGEKK